ncbi:malate synthase A [Nakamurella silvestris]|nr:malate synthase A [Nakamurella silvestris]
MNMPLSTIRIRGEMHPEFDQILTPPALHFLAALETAFAERRADLLADRRARARRITEGEPLALRSDTAHLRALGTWQIAAVAPGLERRRCEITGPPTRRMTINALNSGADVWMADFEDATSPTWFNIIDGQLNLRRAIRRTIDFDTADGREYRLDDTVATIVVRPRGWHLVEKHLTIDGRPLSASLVDFGLTFFHHARELIAGGTGPYFYLPKLESAAEARLWNDIFVLAQDLLDIPRGTIRATVLIETLTAAFEMDEILYELRRHSSGLNAGRWDYLFSFLRTFAGREDAPILPDRSNLTMTVPFMRAYSELLVRTCLRRGAPAIGGMAATVPVRGDGPGTARALAQVKADKEREAAEGFAGSWVAHPGLVPTCLAAFAPTVRPVEDERLPPQVPRRSPAELVAALTDVTGVRGEVTLQGVRTNISVDLAYLTSWIDGIGAVAVEGAMEDAATVEISRIQIWQWVQRRVRTADGPVVTRSLVERLLDAEEIRLRSAGARGGTVTAAREVFTRVALEEKCWAFFTPGAYADHLVAQAGAAVTEAVCPLTA